MKPSILNASHGAHAVVEFVDRGKRYLAGEVYPLDGLTTLKIDGLIAGRRIAYGPPSERLAARAKANRAAMTQPVKAPAPVPKAEQPRAQAGPRR